MERRGATTFQRRPGLRTPGVRSSLSRGRYCSLDQAKASVDDDGVAFWDVRTVGEFKGTTKGWNAPSRLGHLPGAVNLDWAELFDADNGTLKPAAELTTLLGAQGITPQATVVTY